jgi:hypothetical protein
MEVNILEEAKPKVLKLSDGKEYKLPPIDLTTLANIEKSMGFGIGKLGIKLETETMSTLRSLIFALLKEEQPNLDIDKVGHLITLKEISAISSTISEIMALT